jgi:hypothetical protein
MTALALAIALQVEAFDIQSRKATPEIRAAIAKLDAIRVDAFMKAVAAVAAKLPEEHEVLLKALDACDPDPAKFSPHKGFPAETSSRAEVIIEIRYYVEYFASGLLRSEETLRHEMVHAVMRLDLGKERYQKLPKWLREGIAVHLAGQTGSKLIYELATGARAADPERMIDGLEDPDHNLGDYPEDGLAIEYLFSILGKDAGPRLEDVLREGVPYREAIQSLTKRSFDEFLAGAREYSLSAVRKVVAKHKEELALFRRILEKNPDCGPECEQFLKSHPGSPFRSSVLYYRAKGAGDDGLPHFDAFIASAREPGGMAGLIDDAQLRKARLLARKGRTAEALAEYGEIIRWHVGSSIAGDALYEWGLLLHSSDAARAAALLKRALQSFPKHKSAARAKELLGE